MMKVLIAGTLVAGLALAASPTFAQTPAPGLPATTTTPTTPTSPATSPIPGPGKGSASHPYDKAEAQQRWDDCMRQQEAKYGGVQTFGQHAGANGGKGNWKANSKGKPLPPNEKAEAKKGEKENRHQAEMNDCREQLYGRDTPEPGHK
jgi:hypothetical protein